MSDKSVNQWVLYFGSLAFMIGAAIMFLVGIPENGADNYQTFLNIWGYFCLFLAVLLLGATIYTVPNDEYFDKEQLYFVIPGAWFVFDAIRCFSGNADRDPTIWCAVVVALYGILLTVWSLMSESQGKLDSRLTIVISAFFVILFFVQKNNYERFFSENPTNIAGLISAVLIVVAMLLLTWRFVAKMRD